MAVGFLVDFFFYEVGKADFLHSFFSTIAYHLEKGEWGSKYPYLMKHLYYDKLKWTDVVKAKEELDEIEHELIKLSPDLVVWDIEDTTKQPPWGKNISNKVTNLANYFATSKGKTFFDVLRTAIKTCEEEKIDIIIKKI